MIRGSEEWSGEKWNEYMREYYKKNKDKMIARVHRYRASNFDKVSKYKREYWKRLKMVVLEHYGGNPPKCACCGEDTSEFLELDHINNGGNEQRRKIGWGTRFYLWIVRNNFPSGFQVLCANCNQGRRRNHGVCPHKKLEEN